MIFIPPFLPLCVDRLTNELAQIGMEETAGIRDDGTTPESFVFKWILLRSEEGEVIRENVLP